MPGAFFLPFFFLCVRVVMVQGAVLPRGEVLEGRGYGDIDPQFDMCEMAFHQCKFCRLFREEEIYADERQLR